MATPQKTNGKRANDAIDLTNSDEDESRYKKTPRQSQNTPSRPDQRQGTYPTPRSGLPITPRRNGTQSSPSSQSHVGIQAQSSIDLTGDGDDDDNGNELMMGSQAESLASEMYEHYGTVQNKVVGIRYYSGYINPGERAVLRREPQNQYDENAIRVDNMQGQQIGHIPKRLAAKLSKYVDDGDLFLEAVLAGRPTEFDVPVDIFLYGPGQPERRDDIKRQMEKDRLDTRALRQREREAEKQRKEELKKAAKQARVVDKEGPTQWSNDTNGLGDPDKPSADMDEIIGSSQIFNPREMGEVAERFGAQEEDLAKMVEESAPERLSTKMLPYQRQGLAWLLAQEDPQLPSVGEGVVQLWKQPSKGLYTNIATNFSIKNKEPKLARGGILADDMGLGKTLEVIALIVADKVAHPDAGPTLIISPVSVMSNWSGQIERHVSKDDPLRVLTYHGTKRKNMKPKDWDQYDVVITTYGTLSTEYKSKGGKKSSPSSSGLYCHKWRRIVLDEGHIIRNPNTINAFAACAIDAHAHWALTGTPIINSLKDLFSLVKFVGLTGGLEQLEVFNSVLMRPMKEGKTDAQMLLSALMATICLRRHKEMSFIDLRLPELTEYVHRIPFGEHEKKKYEALEAEAKGKVESYTDASAHGNAKEAQQAYRGLLEVLLRLRQVCNHWKLCEERINKLMSILEKQKTVDLSTENIKALQSLLQISIESREDCPICLDDLHNPVITFCAHAFGSECITRVIETQHKCPMCRAELKDEHCLVQPAIDYGDDASDPIKDEDTSTSTKVEALLKIIKAAHKDPGTKVVIFSQWCRFLDIIQPRLEEAGYGIARIDGSMPALARDESLRKLDRDPKTTIMLASLGVCAVGLNLVAANTVVLCDSWWAPAIEDQAVDRVHRLGQTRPTTVWRLVMEGSVEERTLEVQKEKRTLMALAMRQGPQERRRREGGRGRTMRDIQRLLE